MAYYTYYQISEKESWRLATDTPKQQQEIEKMGARRRSILSLSQPVEDPSDRDKVLYKGPFYVDIDSTDISASIEAAREFYQKLKDWNVPMESVGVYASGKKGFHFILHETLFLPDRRGIKHLPLIYKFMALHMFVPGMDIQVYCEGKGNLVRIENVQREDGKYKVRLHPQELETIDAQQYQLLTLQPRTNLTLMPLQPAATVNHHLVQAFHIGKERWKAMEKERPTATVSTELMRPFQDNPPQCIHDLTEYKIKSGVVNFNRAALQLGVFLARSGSSLQTQNSLINLISSRATSQSYPTPKARDRHCRAQLAFAIHTPKYEFSCAVMRGALATRPCENCSLLNKTQEELEVYEIQELADGYYAVGKDGASRRLTSFILVPIKEITLEIAKSRTIRTHVLCTVESNHEYIGQARIEESQWGSRSGFVSAVQGLHNLKVTASDNDIQNLKHFVLRDRDALDQEEVVTAVGVHRRLRYGKPRYTYVEEGLSIDKWRLPNEFTLITNVDQKHSALPDLKSCEIPPLGDTKTEETLRALMSMNLPEVVAPILGWLGACHLKAHIVGLHSQFPLLNLWGGKGSGKTRTISVFCLLSGCDYLTYPPPGLSSITEFPIISTCNSTTTVPRVFDEFNKGGMKPGYYRHASELFKQAFNNSPVMRGRLSRRNEGGSLGAVSDSFYLTAPVALLGEHAPELPALIDRLYSVMLAQPSLFVRRQHMERAVAGRNQLIQTAKAMMLRSLSLRDEWVETQMAAWGRVIPDEFTERQKFARQVIGTGLDFLEEVWVKQLKLDLLQDLVNLKGAFAAVNKDPTTMAGISYATEVDRLLIRLSELVLLGRQHATQLVVTPQMMRSENGALLLDLPMVYALLQLYLNQLNEPMPITSVQQLQALMRSEPYFIDDTTINASMVQFRPITRLSLDKMRQRGIDPYLFA